MIYEHLGSLFNRVANLIAFNNIREREREKERERERERKKERESSTGISL